MIFKTTYFNKWQKKNKILDGALMDAVKEIKDGLLYFHIMQLLIEVF